MATRYVPETIDDLDGKVSEVIKQKFADENGHDWPIELREENIIKLNKVIDRYAEALKQLREEYGEAIAPYVEAAKAAIRAAGQPVPKNTARPVTVARRAPLAAPIRKTHRTEAQKRAIMEEYESAAHGQGLHVLAKYGVSTGNITNWRTQLGLVPLRKAAPAKPAVTKVTTSAKVVAKPAKKAAKAIKAAPAKTPAADPNSPFIPGSAA